MVTKYLKRKLSGPTLLTIRLKSSKQPALSFPILSKVFHCGVRHSSVKAQFGHDATIATPPNLNFTETISNEVWQYGQPSACPSLELICTAQPYRAAERAQIVPH